MLVLDKVSVSYDSDPVISDLTMVVNKGEIGCFLGPSGCGKTTLLRAIAGFERLDQGSIYLNAKLMSSKKKHVPVESRAIGMVFQDYALFPHLTIADNVAFGIRKQPHKQRLKRVHELLELVGLDHYIQRYPHELSGGQQQRVSFVRSLAPNPSLLLLDEPFGSQDIQRRSSLADKFRSILKHENTTAVLVTHDQIEAFALADKVGVVNNGKLLQWDSPYNTYHKPANRFIAEFVGQGAFLYGKVKDKTSIECALGVIVHKQQEKGKLLKKGSSVTLLVRPDDVIITKNGAHKARVVNRLFQGTAFLYTLEVEDGSHILSLASSHVVYEENAMLSFNLDMQHCVVLAQESDE